MSSKAREPQNPDEWREAVKTAAIGRLLHDAKLYGLITGGPEFNIKRCDEILEEGAKLGHHPPSQDELTTWLFKAEQ